MKKDFKFREIPYNYTSFSDREIILKYFDEKTFEYLNILRGQRVTGRSAKLLFEVIGDIFIIERNPYIYNDLLENAKKRKRLKNLHTERLNTIEEGANDNALVLEILAKARRLDDFFFAGFSSENKFRERALKALRGVTDARNIHFSAFHKVSHCTDATDWRVEYPSVVVYPDRVEEIPGLVRAAKKLGLKIIPRGGGTGLTGGAVPVVKRTMVVNMEKLNRIISIARADENENSIPVIAVEAGAVTEDVIDHCREHGYIFATDPTSAWASTIGGNIAENAGGKKCVMWGTAIDNIYSFRIVDATGQVLEVKRKAHPYRKIEPGDEVIFDVSGITERGYTPLKTITLSGTDIRKPGLGKDITNKSLKGTPGIQKEGGDGIIVSASFVLYPPFSFCKTVCLEFFGSNLSNASLAIVDIKNTFEQDVKVFLTALEHFDEKYVRAINYRNKSKRADIPKAVLLIDLESNDRECLEEAARRIMTIVEKYNTEGAIAADDAERELFWKDRKNLGAIARHTNAFKLNEDVVIPLERLPDFADYIEKLNLLKELENHIRVVDQLENYLASMKQRQDEYYNSRRVDSFMELLREKKDNYMKVRDQIDRPGREYFTAPVSADMDQTVFKLIQGGALTVSFEDEELNHLDRMFHGYDEMLERFHEIIRKEKKRTIIIATHMHAGDGNVHVNIPVHSNDYEMMKEADETAGIIMNKTVELGGVISGEHGIGLTKLRFIDQETLDSYAAYKRENDPGDLFNPGKLSRDFPAERIYTPSFNLLELEAFILRATDLEKLSTSIAPCVRCGKCKSVCNTHYPGGTMFYNPRNKILGVGLIMEAVLYDAQTSNSLSFRHFRKLQEISDHCTMCHRCQVPCPVNIDFGAITMTIRELMVRRKKSKFKAITWFTLFYLRRRGYYINKLFRIGLLKIGYGGQRMGHVLNRPFNRITEKIAPRINGFLRGKLPPAGRRSVREALNLKGANTFFSFENRYLPVKKSVFYFPGCGSERMFPEISMAVLALLYSAGVRVVMPPEYLCCGYPLIANGRAEQADIKSYENRVIMHRVADIIGYMEIGHVIVSCGTCFEMLEKYEVSTIFSGAELIDINEFLVSEGLYTRATEDGRPLVYHDPCHSPLKRLRYEKTFQALFGRDPELTGNCCGEGGTLALSTPEISNALRERKESNLLSLGTRRKRIVLTTCPSCVQGLSRINGHVPVEGRSLVVQVAMGSLGKNWEKEYLSRVKKKGIERILF
ncbi:MAG TPA: DUF3683 domain-containing protein [Spirochaetes bacterium]|nr:DUF3683 domain-containing protein [Spirochaetota bacterium]